MFKNHKKGILYLDPMTRFLTRHSVIILKLVVYNHYLKIGSVNDIKLDGMKLENFCPMKTFNEASNFDHIATPNYELFNI